MYLSRTQGPVLDPVAIRKVASTISRWDLAAAEASSWAAAGSTGSPSDGGGGLVEQQDHPRRVLHQLRADAFGRLAAPIDQLVVGAVALELVVEGRGVEPAAENLRVAAPSRRRGRPGCRVPAAAAARRLRDRGELVAVAGLVASERVERLGERGAIGRVERPPHRNREPLVAFDQALVLQVPPSTCIWPASRSSSSSACRTWTALRRNARSSSSDTAGSRRTGASGLM